MTIALYPNKRQARRFETYLETGRHIFNRALEERICIYQDTGKGVTRFDQTVHLTQWRKAEPALMDVPVTVERDALKRVDDGFKAFFRRLKQGDKPGFPRFKAAQRWRSFSISDPGKCIKGGRLHVAKIEGTVRCRNLRPFEGVVKVERILRKAGKWYGQLVIEDGHAVPDKQPIQAVIGIDVGLTHFATLSDGVQVENPRFLRRMAIKLRKDHQRISRRKKGSNRRQLAIQRLQKTYETLSNHRLNFTHHLSKQLVSQYQFIAVEDLQIKNMVRGHFAKSILDAGWGQLRWQLTYKASRAGCTVVALNPRGTSQECSGCGETVKKDLSVRIHKCPHCGLVLGRDENAARVILKRAIEQSAPSAGRAVRNGRGAPISPKAVSPKAGASKRQVLN